MISATNKHSLFAINETTGVISLNGTLDREAVSNYRLRVLVSLTASKVLPVLILNSWCHVLLAENNVRLKSRETACGRTSGTEVLSAVFLDFGVWTVGLTAAFSYSYGVVGTGPQSVC